MKKWALYATAAVLAARLLSGEAEASSVSIIILTGKGRVTQIPYAYRGRMTIVDRGVAWDGFYSGGFFIHGANVIDLRRYEEKATDGRRISTRKRFSYVETPRGTSGGFSYQRHESDQRCGEDRTGVESVRLHGERYLMERLRALGLRSQRQAAMNGGRPVWLNGEVLRPDATVGNRYIDVVSRQREADERRRLLGDSYIGIAAENFPGYSGIETAIDTWLDELGR